MKNYGLGGMLLPLCNSNTANGLHNHGTLQHMNVMSRIRNAENLGKQQKYEEASDMKTEDYKQRTFSILLI
jgi:hypothetical protein